jgi:tetratricopeptide (TPR) repeat protein
MSDNYTHNESLIQYLDGELPQEQIKDLEAAIATDAGLRERLQNLRATREWVKMYGLRQQVQAIHTEMMPQIRPTIERADDQHGLGRRGRVAIMPRLMRAAAIVVFALGMVTLYQYLRLSSAGLYGDNTRAFTLRESRGGTDGQALKQAYQSDRMQETIRIFQQTPNPSPADYFLSGNAYLALGQPADAIHCFRQVQALNQQQQTHVFADDAEYYLAMSYLANRQPAMALPIFEKIHNDPGQLYHDRVGRWFLFKMHWLREGQ